MGGSSKGGGSPSVPNPPKLRRSYGQGAKVYLKYLPQFMAAEDKYRTEEDPKRIEAQQALQDKYGPTQYGQQVSALAQLDPQWLANHMQLGNQVFGDLSLGTQLGAGQQQQIEQNIRGAQAARGNIYGDSAAQAEGYTLGDRGMQLYQQRLQNAGQFLGGPSVVGQVGAIAPVGADRSFAYADPNAGWQGVNAANSAYQGRVGAAAANGTSSGSGWGQYAQLAGTIIGAAMSDRRIKKNITRIGEGPHGVGIYKFAMRHAPGQHIGLIAQDVERKVPGAVVQDPHTGLKAVNYMRAAGVPGPMRIR